MFFLLLLLAPNQIFLGISWKFRDQLSAALHRTGSSTPKYFTRSSAAGVQFGSLKSRIFCFKLFAPKGYVIKIRKTYKTFKVVTKVKEFGKTFYHLYDSTGH
jgi:hypothetical protein